MTTRKPAVKGSTPEERAAVRAERSRINRLNFIHERLRNARNGREVTVVVSNAVLQVGSDLTEEGCRKLAAVVLEAMNAVDVEENRKPK